ncbi:MAG: CDP-archaeol synthase [Verrucomicrobiales bacterium]|nr:CDP-archaeol synthase [Verrucomicrobiales bacterium]
MQITNSRIPQSKAVIFKRRLVSTIALWGIVGLSLALKSDWIFFILILAISLGGLLEYFSMLPRVGHRRFRRHSLLFGFIYISALFAISLKFDSPGYLAFADSFAIFALLFTIVVTQIRKPLEGILSLEEILVAVFGYIYIIILFGFVSKIYLLPPGDSGGSPLFYLIFLCVVTKFTDMGAYAIGSLFGKHKMVPNISPGKTWQGFGGSLLGSLVAGFGCFWLFGDKIPIIESTHVVILSLVLALAAVLGDLAESILKRTLGVKDSGALFPGIGGILDLIDSLLFTAPVLYLYLFLFR